MDGSFEFEPGTVEQADAPRAGRRRSRGPDAPDGGRLPARDRARALHGLVTGEPDLAGLKVVRIYAVTERYAIYAAKDDAFGGSCALCYSLAEDEATARELRRNFAPVAGDVARVCDGVVAVKPDREDADYKAHRARIFALTARAMSLAFEGAPDAAKALLATTLPAVEACRDSRNRMRYVLSITAAFAMIAAAALAVRFSGLPLATASPWTGAPPFVDVVLLGALGAFFSVAIDVRKVSLGHAITTAEMVYAGVVRVPVGAIAGFLAILLAQGGWLPGVAPGEIDAANLHLIAFLAGFSEMVVPNALKNRADRGARG